METTKGLSGECAEPTTDLAQAAKDGDWWFAGPGAWRAELAKQVCVGCPLMTQCRQGAADRQEEYGVWGGEQFPRVPTCPQGHEKTAANWVEVKWADGKARGICRVCRNDRQRRRQRLKAA